MKKSFENQYNFMQILDIKVLTIFLVSKANDVSDISMTLGDALSNINIKMDSMISPYHNISSITPSIHTLHNSYINWNQQKKRSYKSKRKISKAIQCKNPSGKMKPKLVPNKNGSNQDKISIQKSNKNVEVHIKRSPTYNKCPPSSKLSSHKTYQSPGSKHYHDHNSKFFHPPSQVWKIKMATSKCPNNILMSTIIHHKPKYFPHSKNPTSQINCILEETL